MALQRWERTYSAKKIGINIMSHNLLFENGGFHDARVKEIEFQLKNATMKIVLEDVFANFRGESFYEIRSGFLLFSELTKIEIRSQLPLAVGTKVFEILPIDLMPDSFLIKFSPSGEIFIKATSVELFLYDK